MSVVGEAARSSKCLRARPVLGVRVIRYWGQASLLWGACFLVHMLGSMGTAIAAGILSCSVRFGCSV